MDSLKPLKDRSEFEHWQKIIKLVWKRDPVKKKLLLEEIDLDDTTKRSPEARKNYEEANEDMIVDIISKLDTTISKPYLRMKFKEAARFMKQLEMDFLISEEDAYLESEEKLKNMRYLGSIDDMVKIFQENYMILQSNKKCKYNNEEMLNFILDKLPRSMSEIAVQIKMAVMDIIEENSEKDEDETDDEISISWAIKRIKQCVYIHEKREQRYKLLQARKNGKNFSKFGNGRSNQRFKKYKAPIKEEAHFMEDNTIKEDTENKSEDVNMEKNQTDEHDNSDHTDDSDCESAEEFYAFDADEETEEIERVQDNNNNKIDQEGVIFQIDSGASVHVTTQRNLLKNMKPVNVKIKVAKKETYLIAKYKGTLVWNTSTGQTILLQNVLYVPNARNLISVKSLIKDKMEVKFTEQYLTVYAGKTLIEKIPTTNNDKGWKTKVYYDQLKTIKGREKTKIKYQILNLEDTERFHMLFGHPGIYRLKKILR